MGGLALDFTLVVQAINFAIAYVAIRFLLLKPACELIEKNIAHERVLNHKIETATLANNVQEDHRRKQWLEYRTLVKERMPSENALEPLIPLICVTKEPEIKPVDREYATYLVSSIAKDIVERVEHVRP